MRVLWAGCDRAPCFIRCRDQLALQPGAEHAQATAATGTFGKPALIDSPCPVPVQRDEAIDGSTTRALVAAWCWPTRAACSLPRCSCICWPRPMPAWACGSRLLLHCPSNAAVHGTCALLKPAAPRSPVSCMCTPLTWLAALSTVAGALAGGHPARPSRADRAFYSLRCHGDAIVPRTALSRASRLALTAPAGVASPHN